MTTHVATPIRTYSQFVSQQTFKVKARTFIRDNVVIALSYMKAINNSASGWIRFPYYHHVFDDERTMFNKQISYLKNFGDFISLEEAIYMPDPGKGKFFCLTFDDGFKNCITNALPIIKDNGITATFFVATKFIESDIEKSLPLYNTFFSSKSNYMEFLSWNDCRKMIAEGMSIGSHTMTHRTLISLSDEDVEQELKDSKAKIEEELDVECRHFCAPVGVPDEDFKVSRDPLIARKIGYKSFLTTQRGANRINGNPFHIKRDHVLASWNKQQLRYFFSQE